MQLVSLQIIHASSALTVACGAVSFTLWANCAFRAKVSDLHSERFVVVAFGTGQLLDASFEDGASPGVKVIVVALGPPS